MRVFSTSLPVMLNDMFWGIGFTLYTVAYGLLGTNALASTQIARNIEQIFLVFDFGIASAALVMVGNLIGAGQSDKARDYARKLILISLAVGVGMGLILFCSAPFILTFYQVSQTVAKDAISILYLFAATLPVKVAASTVIVGIYRGGGTAAYAARSELFALWMVGLPLSFFGATVLNLPITLLVLCQFSEDLVKLTLGLIRLRRGDWIRSVL
jgi:Na+-driven multidrug efflux pump